MANNSAAKVAANKRYTQKNYERLQAYVKPQVVQSVREYTAARGESIAAFLTRSVYGQMERDGGVTDMPQAGGEDTGEAYRRQKETMHRFREAMRECDEPVPVFERVNFEERVFFEPEAAIE